VQHILSTEPHCSEGLRTAIEPQVRRLRGGYSVPVRDCRFGPQHIPQYLPADWYDRYFQGLTGLNPRLLRRLASIKLVQMTQGGSPQTAARRLGLPPGRHRAVTDYRIQRWALDEANSARLHAALEALACELDATGDLIDYDRRRDALEAWSIPVDDWHELAADLRQRQGRIVNADWGDPKRRAASALVWARVTQGEHRFAPLFLQEKQTSGRGELVHWVRQMTYRSRTGRHDHHYVALRAALDAYADQLATRIDSG
jgi:hypothetical protein